MAVPIRRLGPGDVAALRDLNGVFAEAFEEPDVYLGAPPTDAWLDRLLARPDFAAFVAEDGARVVGGLTLYLFDKPEQAWSEGYLYDLAMTEGHRRRGIARALIGAACDWAAAQGASVVYVQAHKGDDPAIALYTSLTAREEILHFELPVTPAAGR